MLRCPGATITGANRGNAFDFLRLTAAIAVLVSHSLSLTGHAETFDGESLGDMAVVTFFAISGFLVSRSWALQPETGVFLAKRLLRLMPALIVIVVLTSYVLGPLETTLPLARYLSASTPHTYTVYNVLLHARYGLPGVFENVPYHAVVNGSLWTLSIEAKCYVLVLVLGVGGFVGRRPWGTMLIALGAGALMIPALRDLIPHGGVLANAPGAGDDGLVLVGVFSIASLTYTLRAKVPLRPILLLAAACVWAGTVLFHQPMVHRFATILIAPYLVIGLAHVLPPSLSQAVTRRGDLSYGIYLVAFPVEQIAAQAFHPTPLGMVAFAVPISAALAAVSWRFVEHPALMLKQRLPRPRIIAAPSIGPSEGPA
jgi:peptidoglycan/LPS O-acetylase OafA/YrhL